jgi:hypothetical protein
VAPVLLGARRARDRHLTDPGVEVSDPIPLLTEFIVTVTGGSSSCLSP